MRWKRKADCTPEEWAAYLAYARANSAKNAERPEVRAARAASWRKYMATEHGKAARARYESGEKYRNRNRSPSRLAYQRQWQKQWRALRKLQSKGQINAAEAMRKTLLGDPLYAAASAAVPAAWPAFKRDDVISMIVLAVLDGEFDVENIATGAKGVIRDYNRQHSHFSTVSIDAVIPGTDGLLLIDTIASDAVHL